MRADAIHEIAGSTLMAQTSVAPVRDWLFEQILPVANIPYHGIEAFARHLAAHLQPKFPLGGRIAAWCDFSGRPVPQGIWRDSIAESHRRLQSQIKSGGKGALLVHFDYGSYGWWDLPVWLPREISRLKRALPGVSVGVFAHEIYPPQPRRRREQALLGLSRWVTGAVLKAADVVFTSNPNAAALIAARHGVEAQWSPVFSNIGELSGADFIQDKAPREWVVFGSPGNLPRYLDSLAAELPDLPGEIRPASISVVGGSASLTVRERVDRLRRRVPALCHAPVATDAECRAILERARFLYLRYFDNESPAAPEMLFKSSVFAAANAHGVVCVLPNGGGERLSEQADYPGAVWKENGRWVAPRDLAELPDRLLKWYRDRGSLDRMASMITDGLFV